MKPFNAPLGADYASGDNPSNPEHPMKMQSSPWGHVQSQKDFMPGLSFVSTASHGGFFLDSELWAYLLRHLPGFKSWAGPNWLEEDCDASAVALLWPKLMGGDAASYAVRACASDWWSNAAACRAYLDTPAGQAARLVAAQWEEDNSKKWEVGSCGSSGAGWWVHLRRIGDGATREVVLRDYPVGPLSDSDIERGIAA